jgi:hypothetical protein
MDMELFANLLPAFAVGLAQALPRIIIHAMFAAGIYRDADAMRREDSGPFLVSPKVWAFASFTCGVFFWHVLYGFLIVILYWIFHYSILKGGKNFAEHG